MKNNVPENPELREGRRYWRSFDELAGTPEFQQWVQREFPEGASEWTDPVTRRHFVRIMSASFLLAGAGLAGTGCRRPEEKILPFGKMPERYIHGQPQYYATAMPTRGSAIPLVVKAHEGRPIKVEGNAQHPDSNGGTDRFAQASILNLYDPDRATVFRKDGNTTSRDSALDFLTKLSQEVRASGGRGLSFLMEQGNSPSRARLQEAIGKALPEAKWFVYEPVDLDMQRRAASAAFNAPVKPYYHFDAAKVVVALDCDFLGSEEDVHLNMRRFAQARDVDANNGVMNRLYAVESLYTLTGFNADHRLRLPGSAVAQLAAALAAEIVGPDILGGASALTGKIEGVDPKWIIECARDLKKHAGESLVVAGHRQPLGVHLLAHAINNALKNIGKTVTFLEAPVPRHGSLMELAQALQAGQVSTLVILGGNPVYNAPADLDWAALQKKAGTVVRLGYYEDETTPLCTWHLPAAHYLESWGDSRTADGTLVPVQPLISPLFGGLTELEVLAHIGGLKPASPYDIAQETFASFLASGANTEEAWKKYLHDGFLPGSAGKPVSVTLNPAAFTSAISELKPVMPSKEALEVVFHRDYKLDDGRYNNNGWLQELPDPITKIAWDNVILMSRRTARAFGLKNSDVVEITLGNRSIRGPVWVQPGMADFSLGLALGYGREKTGRVGHKTGFNAYPLRTTTASSMAVGAKLSPTGGTYVISCTQDHWSMEGRSIVREANLSVYKEVPDFAKKMVLEEPPKAGSLYPNPLDKVKPIALHQWGMAIDLNRCAGCSACVLACQSENNVPIVGKDQVRRGREMHWLRIDRYYSGPPTEKTQLQTFEKDTEQQFQTWIDDPQVVTQPMLCQHCEAAPCENVCPVNATSHDQEGLNVMTYNRCVGTRYCSNNCPYKVRRFNYFDYNKRPIDKLYYGPLATRKEDEWDLLKLIKNPDVTVRMRGVMEKCTFCLQRIEGAKIAQKVKAGATGDVVVPEGTFTTACAQACSAEAIVFGNLNDPESRVSKLKKRERDYSVLEFLFTRPRTTYLARIRNPNPEMPDYVKAPFTFQNYEQRMGNPLEHHESGNSVQEFEAAPKGAH